MKLTAQTRSKERWCRAWAPSRMELPKSVLTIFRDIVVPPTWHPNLTSLLFRDIKLYTEKSMLRFRLLPTGEMSACYVSPNLLIGLWIVILMILCVELQNEYWTGEIERGICICGCFEQRTRNQGERASGCQWKGGHGKGTTFFLWLTEKSWGKTAWDFIV